MDAASSSSGRVIEEIRIDRKSRPRARSRYPYSSMDVTMNLDIYVVKGTNLLRDGYLRAGEALQRHYPSHQTTGMLLRVGLCHLPSCFMPILAKRSRSRSHSLHDRGRSDKKGCRDNQKQGYKTSERYQSDQVAHLAFKVQRMHGRFCLSKLLLTCGFPARFIWMLIPDQVASLRGLSLN